jgi:hypothetical protein
VIAYSHCIAHGYEMKDGLDQQYRAVASGHWRLIRYDPMVRATGGNPFLLDSPRPRMGLADYRKGELRFRSLANTDPVEAERLLGLAQQTVYQRWRTYEEMATRGAHDFPADAPVQQSSKRLLMTATTPARLDGCWPLADRTAIEQFSQSSVLGRASPATVGLEWPGGTQVRPCRLLSPRRSESRHDTAAMAQPPTLTARPKRAHWSLRKSRPEPRRQLWSGLRRVHATNSEER